MSRECQTDILIVGGGLGGVAAALAALRLGKKILVTEETDWIGGQLTAQAVPPDEHPWIEGTGCTETYQRLRCGIRDYDQRNYPLLPEARFDTHLNPGQGRVSPLCHEPRVALAVLDELLAPYRTGGQAEIVLNCKPVHVETAGDRVTTERLLVRTVGGRLRGRAPLRRDAGRSTELVCSVLDADRGSAS